MKKAKPTKHPLYGIWVGMKSRCGVDYGYWDVRVCARWQRSFWAFVRDMGPRPSPKHSIDRKNSFGHYTPKNCKWSTPREQGANMRTNRFIEFNGLRLHLAEWSRRVGIPASTIRQRISLQGWSAQRALTEPSNYYLTKAA